jgi:malonate transporter and related proteins
MQALLEVVLPVFLVIGFGYLAVLLGWFTDEAIEALMGFATNFAIPCLLFNAIASLDLGAHFEPRLLFSYYAAATLCFFVGMLGARKLFGRSWPDAVSIGFCCLFANSVLLGLPITERAYGADALEPNYALVALNAPFCYGLGMTAMEIARAGGSGVLKASGRVVTAMFRNALVIAILLGALVNIAQVPLPGVLTDATSLVARAALPVALFGLGGVLVRYKPEGDLRAILFVVAVTLALRPAITWGLGTATGISTEAFRSAVLTAAMAPGANAYIFARMYGAAQRVAASSVLVATGVSTLTVWLWLLALP